MTMLFEDISGEWVNKSDYCLLKIRINEPRNVDYQTLLKTPVSYLHFPWKLSPTPNQQTLKLLIKSSY